MKISKGLAAIMCATVWAVAPAAAQTPSPAGAQVYIINIKNGDTVTSPFKVQFGLTGMGGGALLTPMLILLFGINPGTAVSSDLLTSLIMRPVGGTVHARRGTVAWDHRDARGEGTVRAAAIRDTFKQTMRRFD